MEVAAKHVWLMTINPRQVTEGSKYLLFNKYQLARTWVLKQVKILEANKKPGEVTITTYQKVGPSTMTIKVYKATKKRKVREVTITIKLDRVIVGLEEGE